MYTMDGADDRKTVASSLVNSWGSNRLNLIKMEASQSLAVQ